MHLSQPLVKLLKYSTKSKLLWKANFLKFRQRFWQNYCKSQKFWTKQPVFVRSTDARISQSFCQVKILGYCKGPCKIFCTKAKIPRRDLQGKVLVPLIALESELVKVSARSKIWVTAKYQGRFSAPKPRFQDEICKEKVWCH